MTPSPPEAASVRTSARPLCSSTPLNPTKGRYAASPTNFNLSVSMYSAETPTRSELKLSSSEMIR